MSQPEQMSQTLEITRGDTKEWTFAVIDGTGAAVNLTGITSAFFTAKASITEADTDAGVIQKTIGNGITVDAGSAGTGTIKLVPADTSASIDARVTLVFDFEIIVGGNTYTPAGGSLLIYPDVTRS